MNRLATAATVTLALTICSPSKAANEQDALKVAGRALLTTKLLDNKKTWPQRQIKHVPESIVYTIILIDILSNQRISFSWEF